MRTTERATADYAVAMGGESLGVVSAVDVQSAYLRAIALMMDWPLRSRLDFIEGRGELSLIRVTDGQEFRWRRWDWTRFVLSKYPGIRMPDDYVALVRSFESRSVVSVRSDGDSA